jgi:YHS domain-containing protein
MCPLSREKPDSSKPIRAIVPRFTLPQGFETLCGVLKTSLMVLVGIVAVPLTAPAQGFRPNDMIVNEKWSGAAIFGYDPVGFFVEQAAVVGRQQFQLAYRGVIWHFASASNRAAFEADPSAYLPAFGGYDPVGAARGVPIAGNPLNFAVVDGRLFLFRTTENRTQFLARPEIRAEAERLWPEVSLTLSP